MAKNLEQIMDEIHQMQQNVAAGQGKEAGKKPRVTDDEIREYVNKEISGEKVDKTSAASKYIADLLARNPKIRKGDEGLAKSLPQANEARREKMAKLRNDASRSGIKKVFRDITGAKRREARKELQSIAKDKLRSNGKKTIDEKTALKDISAGRGRSKWNLLQPLMNYFGLGSHGERHNPEQPFPKMNGFDRKGITAETPNGKLDGMVYKPKEGEDKGKVVLFFSGSGGPAGEYCKPALDKYLNAGATVVTMDYRGFGKSETRNKNGQKIGTPLSEQSIYEDGKEMLNYVVKTMGVKPENIILHGFSLGGAVASKVAADFYQEQQKKALEEGRTLKEQKLGGIVLHSPIDSMYSAAKGQMGGLHLAGMLGWAGAGAYNTKSHMQRLSKLDPDIPVHYVSGNIDKEDHLDIAVTKIDQDPEAKFRNKSSFRGPGGHEADNLAEDDCLEQMAKEGRDVQLSPPEQQRQHESADKGVAL